MKKILWLVALGVVAGCGGGGNNGGGEAVSAAPVISDLKYSPARLLQGKAGNLSNVSGSISVTDPNGDVTQLCLQSADSTGNYSPVLSDLNSAGNTSFSGRTNVSVRTDKAGVYDFLVSVIDSKGNESNKLNGSVVIVQNPNFVIDGPVAIDSNSGLTWTLDALTPGPYVCTSNNPFKTWSAAARYVSCLNTNQWLGWSNWRLPTKDELSDMSVYAIFKPISLMGGSGGFHGLDDTVPYWSKDEVVPGSNIAWAVHLYRNNDNGQSADAKDDGRHIVWPVRDSR